MGFLFIARSVPTKGLKKYTIGTQSINWFLIGDRGKRMLKHMGRQKDAIGN